MSQEQKYAGKRRTQQSYKKVKIRPRGGSWQADFGTRAGKRDQKSFGSLDEARQAIDIHLLQVAEQSRFEAIGKKDKMIGWHNLSEREKVDAVSALEMLADRVSLMGAARHYLSTVPDANNQRTVQEVFSLYLASKEASGKRPETIKDYQKVGRFAADMGNGPIHEITTEDLESWLNKRRYKDVTRANYRRHLCMFFKFAMQRRYVQRNVADAIPKVSIDETLPTIFTVEETQRLMNRVSDVVPQMEPYFAIGLFSGLRPNELECLDWEQIDLDKHRITVRPEVAKKRRQRYVDISDNLLEWLLPYRKQRGRIYFSRHWFDKARGVHRNNKKIEPIVPWSGDVMRHSYGSYHLGMHEDAARTSLQMGHTTQGILFEHYRNLVTKEDSEAFWSIVPATTGNIIPLGAVTAGS
jgi:integrase